MDAKEALKFADLFRTATLSPNIGNKISGEIVSVSENDGMRTYIVKLDTFDGQLRTLHFLVDK